MAIQDSELNDAGVFQLVPNGIYNAHVVANVLKSSKAGAPMVVLDWMLEQDQGDFAGRKIRFDNVMLGGLSKDKKPLSLGQLCSFLHYTGVPWKCKACGTEYSEPKAFFVPNKQEAEEHGLKVGNYYCRECKNPKPAIIYDTDHFLGARCGIRVGSSKQEGTDKEFNNVISYTDLKE